MQIVNSDGAGEGFNDTTSASAVGGNTATTLGAQRLAVFNKAADILNQTFNITQTIEIESKFDPLECYPTYGVLGSAGPKYAYQVSESGVWTDYPISLANEHFGTDLVPSGYEIRATFNSEIGTTGCLESSSWYLGFDTPTSGTSLLSVVMHEIMHGMGFLSFMAYDGTTQFLVNGTDPIFDPYTKQLFDATQGTRLTNLGQSDRAASELNDGNLVWDGAQVNSNISGLSAGVNGSRVQMYAPSSYNEGSSVSHFDTAVYPNELMEPQYTGFLDNPGLAKYLLADIGWTLQNSGNNAPVFTPLADQTLNEDSSKTVTLAASDSDGDSLTYSLTSAPAELGVSLSGTTLTIAPQADYSGSGTVVVGVSDGQDTDSDSFLVTVTAVNDAPVLTAIGDKTLAEDNTISITLAATDVDSGSLTYSLDSAATELGASLSDNTLTITPIADYSGSGNITVSVSDGQLSDAETFQVTVTAVNDAPVFSMSTSYNIVQSNAQDITLSATDVENDSLTYSLVSYDSGMVTVSLSDTETTLTVTGDSEGSTTISVAVSDGNISVSADLSFTISSTPNSAPVWSAPAAVTVMAGGAAAEQTLAASDADNDSLSFSVLSVPDGLSASVSGTTLSVAADAGTAGNYVLTLSVTDGIDPVSTTVGVTVVPELTLTSGDSSLTDGDTFTVSNEATIFTLAGGDNSLTTTLYYGGRDRDDLISVDSSGNYTLAMPDSGAFAGVYTLTVSDGNGFTASYYLERPLRLIPAVSPVMINPLAMQMLKIEGAPAATTINLDSSNGNLSFADDQSGAITQVVATDDEDNFNPALVYLALHSDLTAGFSTDISALASNIPDSVLTLEAQMPRTLTVAVQDTSGSAIDNAIVSVYDERFSIWGFDDTVTASNGQASIHLPNEAITLYTDASGYLEKETQLNSTQTLATVTLTSSATAFTLSGIIQSSGFNFSEELPVIELYFTDGSKETLSAEQISVSSVRYRWDGDLDQQLPDYLRVSHSLGSTIDTDVVTAYPPQDHQHYADQQRQCRYYNGCGEFLRRWWWRHGRNTPCAVECPHVNKCLFHGQTRICVKSRTD
ncbi:tandem-95 repeat protein [Thalassolituus marinus]|uniref:Tandem-95 repeat protein n=1 Tax=Thalassolituus marinus TaxID=671053 RepID=A0ABS7ZRY8_9GAMM|nr:tandem-95 repeat protein [Thalassolituus marinus]MCA6064449.1 tandem-95 repeat protein [Thalassolituus marinus]